MWMDGWMPMDGWIPGFGGPAACEKSGERQRLRQTNKMILIRSTESNESVNKGRVRPP